MTLRSDLRGLDAWLTRDPGDQPFYRELSHTTPFAAKEYICNRCKKPIAKGERHTKFVGLNEDGFFCERVHTLHYHGDDE
jgi:hypothetical protein